MSYLGRALGLMSVGVMLVVLSGGTTDAAAQGTRPTSIVYGDSATLTVSVLPLQAEVRLDGVLLGSAHELLARALPMLPGDHVVEAWAAGYLPSVVYVPGTPNWASHVRLDLVPDRQP
ncbi:MAG TPA: hypothetical protein VMS64_12210 [Candidatus Methylomirabilis sp.]|nr:hypothetical protein [Candidatus Methylomirabilis sp.]